MRHVTKINDTIVVNITGQVRSKERVRLILSNIPDLDEIPPGRSEGGLSLHFLRCLWRPHALVSHPLVSISQKLLLISPALVSRQATDVKTCALTKLVE